MTSTGVPKWPQTTGKLPAAYTTITFDLTLDLQGQILGQRTGNG